MTARGSVQFGDTLIEYTVLRSKRRKKTIAITLDPHDGILVAAPMEATPDQVGGVVRKRAGWIVRNANGAVLRPAPRLRPVSFL